MSTPDADALVGRTLGHFRVLARVGDGGMGIVYRAMDERLHRVVALKLLPDEAMRDEAHRRRFLREARSAAAVSHTNVAAVHDVGEIDGRVYLAMEYVEGITLAAEIAARKIPLPECLRIAKGIARALAKAHEKGVVHRDLKPDNVMLNEDREVKVLDFGLAKLLEDVAQSRSILEVEDTALRGVTADGRIVGTPSYMSPEQATGRPVDARADLFSFGVLLYEMVTGVRPFVGASAVEILVAVTRDEPVAPSQKNPLVPEMLERLIARCLAKRPEDRFVSAREIVAALDALEGVRSSPSGDSQRLAALPNLLSVDTTVTKESLRPVRSATPRGLRAWGPIVAGVVALAGIGIFALARRLGTEGAGPAAPSTATTARHGPAGRPPNPDADALYAHGEKMRREGRRDLACDDDAHASAIDPSFAKAALAAALCHLESPNDGRALFRQAWDARATLDEGDAALLYAVEPVFLREHEDDIEEGHRLEEVARRFPDDARIHVIVASSLRRFADSFTDVIAELDRSLALDPQQPYVLELKSDYAAYAGNFTLAQSAIEQCLKIAPAALGCLLERTWINGEQGRCDLVEGDARRMLAIDPGSGEGAQILANALYAEGRPIETVREVLHRKWDRVAEEARAKASRVDQIHLAVLAGDFVTAEKLARQAWTEAEDSSLSSDHGRAARLLVDLDREMGRDGDAADVAKRYLDGRDAWEPSVRLDDWAMAAEPTPRMLMAELRAGKITEAKLDAELAKTIKSWESHVESPIRPFIWLHTWVAAAETPARAEAAMAALDRFQPLPPYTPLSLIEADVGRTYLLAKRSGDAIKVLERATRACFPVDHSLDQTHAWLWLGQARESEGDTAGACKAYGVVRSRWGAAKPRSMTGQIALARWGALKCSE